MATVAWILTPLGTYSAPSNLLACGWDVGISHFHSSLQIALIKDAWKRISLHMMKRLKSFVTGSLGLCPRPHWRLNELTTLLDSLVGWRGREGTPLRPSHPPRRLCGLDVTAFGGSLVDAFDTLIIYLHAYGTSFHAWFGALRFVSPGSAPTWPIRPKNLTVLFSSFLLVIYLRSKFHARGMNEINFERRLFSSTVNLGMGGIWAHIGQRCLE